MKYGPAIALSSALAAFLSYLPDPVLGGVAAFLALGIGFWIGIRPTRDSLLALALLLLPVSLFPVGGQSDSFAPFYAEGVTFGFGTGCALLAIRWGFSGSRGTMVPRSFAIYARILGVALLLAIASGVWGYQVGNNGFSASIRYVLVASSFLWGAHLNVPRQSLQGRPVILRGLTFAGVAMLVFPSMVSGHGVFVIAGICAAMSIRSRDGRTRSAFMAVPLVVALLIAFQYTLTVLGIVVVALSLSYIGNRSRPAHRRVLTHWAVFLMLMASVTVVTVGITHGSDMAMPLETATLVDAIQSKTLSDRGPLWRAAWRELSLGSNMLRASGDTIVLYGFPNSFLGHQVWVGGVHNTVLQTAFTGGWLFAFAMVALAGIAVSGAATSLFVVGRKPWWVTVCAAAGIALMMAGGLTGQFVVEPAAGFWIWLMLGAAASPQTRSRTHSLRRIV